MLIQAYNRDAMQRQVCARVGSDLATASAMATGFTYATNGVWITKPNHRLRSLRWRFC